MFIKISEKRKNRVPEKRKKLADNDFITFLNSFYLAKHIQQLQSFFDGTVAFGQKMQTIMHGSGVLKFDLHIIPSSQFAYDLHYRFVVEIEISLGPKIIMVGIHFAHFESAVGQQESIFARTDDNFGCRNVVAYLYAPFQQGDMRILFVIITHIEFCAQDLGNDLPGFYDKRM